MEPLKRTFSSAMETWENIWLRAADLLPRFEIFHVEWRRSSNQRTPIYLECQKRPMYRKSARLFIFILHGILFPILSQLFGLNGTDQLLVRVITGVLLSGSLFTTAVSFHICQNGDTLATAVNGFLSYQFSQRLGKYLM